MPNEYNGKVLRVDLSTSRLEVEELSEEIYRKYLGGSALNLYYILREMPSGTNPHGLDNILSLSLRVVTGAPISGQSRMTAMAESSIADAIGDSQCGGYWPAKRKFAGFDTISCGATIAWAMETFEAGLLTTDHTGGIELNTVMPKSW